MRSYSKIQWALIIVAALAFIYVASGYICILLNNVPLLLSFGKYYPNLTIDMVLQNYPHALQSIGIAFGIAVAAILVLLFAPARESLHGTARFATRADIKKMGLFSPHGIIVGKYDNQLLRFGGQQFVSVGAPTRSGKGIGIVIPNLLEWTDSCVVQDIKQECYDYTSGYRQKVLKQEVYLFNPFSPDKTHRYNPLSYIDMEGRNADLELTDFANILYPTAGADSNTIFFNQLAQNLFIGLCLMNRDVKRSSFYQVLLEHDITLPFTLKGILELSEGIHLKIDDETTIKGFEETYSFFERGDILSNECKRRLESYFSISSDNTRSGVLSSFNAPLLMFRSETLDNATSESDFDLRDLRKKKMTIYVGITPDQLANAKLILNIFWAQLILVNTKELPQKNSELKYPCLLLMDEFTAPGAIDILQKAVSFIAGYNLRFLIIFQSISQLETKRPDGYDKEGAKTLLTNIACQILYAPREQEDAERFSKLLGNKTVKNSSTSFNKGWQASRSESETSRALMLPQELRELPYNKEVVTVDSGKPILCSKAIYYSDKYFMDKFKLVAPSLRRINGIPTKKEFETAILNGECKMRENFLRKHK
ncbi:MAG: type IV secretory system conjugative DNA transfer family protein [Campylobacteraceae bacterium]|jgi:type IV secretion system protein VirD4|nr:type IV secretory system conjugative DNA transfer family protein [Campylobacteraceae bacterium]